jgi:hypothetical protein
MNLPRHAADIELNVVRVKRGAKEATVFLDGIRWFVLAAKQRDTVSAQGWNSRSRLKEQTALITPSDSVQDAFRSAGGTGKETMGPRHTQCLAI